MIFFDECRCRSEVSEGTDRYLKAIELEERRFLEENPDIHMSGSDYHVTKMNLSDYGGSRGELRITGTNLVEDVFGNEWDISYARKGSIPQKTNCDDQELSLRIHEAHDNLEHLHEQEDIWQAKYDHYSEKYYDECSFDDYFD